MKNRKSIRRTEGRPPRDLSAVTTAEPRAVVSETPPPYFPVEELSDFASMLNHLRRSTQEEIAALHHEAVSAEVGISDYEVAALIGRQVVFLRNIEGALHRISTGSYGRCMACGQMIDRNRLMAVPVTRLCTACKGN